MKTATKRDLATSFTSLIFLVIGISGVMLYFHFYDMQVRELHETLGLAFVVATLFHIFVNWKNMKNYFSKKIFIIAAIITPVITSGFIINSLDQNINPKTLVLQSVVKAPLEDSLKVLNIELEDAMNNLKAEYVNGLDSKNIFEIAKANETSPFKVILVIKGK